jgi:flavin reductase (DIM6/NTAB) family NADH-FMN oxidoreductase RutF
MDNRAEYIAAFDRMVSGVYIITSAYRQKPAGCTVVWASRAAFSPPLMAVYMADGFHTIETIEKGKRFCLNVLGESLMELARYFGTASGHTEDKFQDVQYHTGTSGSPVLAQALGYIDCKLERIIPLGDHQLVLGEVVDAAVMNAGPPLIYDPETFYIEGVPRTEGLARQAEGSAQ